MIRSGGRKTDSAVNIKLLMRCQLVDRAKMDQVFGAAALREIFPKFESNAGTCLSLVNIPGRSLQSSTKLLPPI